MKSTNGRKKTHWRENRFKYKFRKVPFGGQARLQSRSIQAHNGTLVWGKVIESSNFQAS